LKLLLVDNHDSFTWNLAHYFEELGARVEVRTNDAVDAAALATAGYGAIVISPGPGRPEQAGATPAVIEAVAGRLPLLGVCLGHQAIAQAFGGRVVAAPSLVHGKTSPIEHSGRGIYRGMPNPFRATRYHSLVVEAASLPAELVVDAWTASGVVMGLAHARWPITGVQFHPEAWLTEGGHRLLANFLEDVARGGRAARRPAEPRLRRVEA
jgi:anthranilate synthase/aminodeoxychorismate synthase-like glutamine amidotransferase